MLTNKVMKHGFVGAMEDILDADKKITHEKLATQVTFVISKTMHHFDTHMLHAAVTISESRPCQPTSRAD